MISFVNVCDVKSAEKRYAYEYDIRFSSSMPWVTCGQEKAVLAKGIYFLGKNKITDFICLKNRGIFPPNM